MTPDWERERGEYAPLREWTYCNTATFGLLSRSTKAAIARHLEHRDELACADFLSWFDDIDRTREKAARLIGAEAEDIAFAPNASTALSLLLGGMGWRAGDRVVSLTDEFPNQIYYAAQMGGRGVEFVQARWEEFSGALTERTRAVLVSQVSYSSGFRPPLEEIAGELEKRGILLFVDATQALGALTVDVAALRPAMLAVHGYKWMLAPTGAGFFYVRPDVREWLAPNVIGWRSHHDWRNVNQLHAGAPEFKSSAEKYEGGMPSFSNLYALDNSIATFLRLGPEAVERRVLGLTRQLRERLLEIRGAEILHPESPITVVRFPVCDAGRLAATLREERILASARHGGLRLSLHYYNNEADLDRLFAVLIPAIGG
jgi:cysteine desulfurase / selenocysteine lyase